MGLAVAVGTLADLLENDPEGAEWLRGEFEAVNAVLARHNLPPHHEPERLDVSLFEQSHACSSFPYSFLHYLRRAYAHMDEGRPIPDEDELTAAHESVIEDASTMFSSHLLCHSDCEGMYVPIDFAEPIFDDEIPTGMLGSSQGLLREVLAVAPHIGVTLVDGRPTPACEAELQEIEDSGPFWRERVVWYALWEAATQSIAHRTAIVFQ
jgi:hypothetical protein